jgi:hypothetical protein
MKRAAAVLSLAALLGAPGLLAAHEGHAHKVMGTVVAIDQLAHRDRHEGREEAVLCAHEGNGLPPGQGLCGGV